MKTTMSRNAYPCSRNQLNEEENWRDKHKHLDLLIKQSITCDESTSVHTISHYIYHYFMMHRLVPWNIKITSSGQSHNSYEQYNIDNWANSDPCSPEVGLGTQKEYFKLYCMYLVLRVCFLKTCKCILFCWAIS